MMSDDNYKSLFYLRSLPIVKSMYRLQKDNELKRAKSKARTAARAEAKARVS